MFGLLQKIMEVLVSIGTVLSLQQAPIVSPTPEPSIEIVDGESGVSTPTPTRTPTPTPDIPKLIGQIEELKELIINYTPEPTPTPQIVFVTPLPTPAPTPVPVVTPAPDTKAPIILWTQFKKNYEWETIGSTVNDLVILFVINEELGSATIDNNDADYSLSNFTDISQCINCGYPSSTFGRKIHYLIFKNYTDSAPITMSVYDLAGNKYSDTFGI